MDVGKFVGDSGIFGATSASGSPAGVGAGRVLKEGGFLKKAEKSVVDGVVHDCFIDGWNKIFKIIE